MRRTGAALIAASCLLGACTRNPSVLLDPAGTHAGKTAHLFWYLASVEGVVLVLVLGAFFAAIWRRRERGAARDPAAASETIEPAPATERRLALCVAIAVGVTALILTSFVAASYLVDKQLIGLDRDADLEVEVTAHQWWWELRYISHTPSEIFTTANELHVPVGAKVKLMLRSQDVIHSLWFPNLSGKKDIIPGRDQDLYLHPEREGVWKGLCGEFCGLQHAQMQITLFADSKEGFEAWRRAQLEPAREPESDAEKRGRKVFETSSCVLCHAIRTARFANWSDRAPDLTHLKSRTTIGAGAARNTKGYLGGWILDPHGIKPGVHMPTQLQEPRDFQALLAYLETLR